MLFAPRWAVFLRNDLALSRVQVHVLHTRFRLLPLCPNILTVDFSRVPKLRVAHQHGSKPSRTRPLGCNHHIFYLFWSFCSVQLCLITVLPHCNNRSRYAEAHYQGAHVHRGNVGGSVRPEISDTDETNCRAESGLNRSVPRNRLNLNISVFSGNHNINDSLETA